MTCSIIDKILDTPADCEDVTRMESWRLTDSRERLYFKLGSECFIRSGGKSVHSYQVQQWAKEFWWVTGYNQEANDLHEAVFGPRRPR